KEQEAQVKNGPSSVEIGKFAVQRNRDGHRDHVHGADPSIELEAAEITNDRGHRGRDDRGLERGHEHREENGDDGERPVRLHDWRRCARGGNASRNARIVAPSSFAWRKPVAFLNADASTTTGYLMWASAPRGSFGRPSRPSASCTTISGKGTSRRPVSR